jgi:hypothetical protein
MLTPEQRNICNALGIGERAMEAALAAKSATAANAAGARPSRDRFKLRHFIGVAGLSLREGLRNLPVDPAAARRHFAGGQFYLASVLEECAPAAVIRGVDAVAAQSSVPRSRLLIVCSASYARRNGVAIMRADSFQVIQEQLGRVQGDVSGYTTPAQLISRAIEALQSWTPDAPDGWVLLAEAAALISIVIEREAPAFANRPHDDEESRRRRF